MLNLNMRATFTKKVKFFISIALITLQEGMLKI